MSPQLAGAGTPRILVAVEADDAAEEEHRDADIRVDAKQQRVQVRGHDFHR